MNDYMVWMEVLAFLTGASIFSFFNVVIYRVPLHMDIKKRSHCTSCGHVLSMIDMVPVLSWILLRGRCRYCHMKLSVRYTLVEVLGGCAALLCIHEYGISGKALITFAFLLVLTVVAFVDMDTMKIPNSFVIAAGMIGVVSIFFFPEIGWLQRGVGMVSISIPLFAVNLVVPGGFGGGDIKLMAACGLFLGWERSLLAFVFAILISGVYCIFVLVSGKKERRSRFAFGPFLCIGMAAVVFGNIHITSVLGI